MGHRPKQLRICFQKSLDFRKNLHYSFINLIPVLNRALKGSLNLCNKTKKMLTSAMCFFTYYWLLSVEPINIIKLWPYNVIMLIGSTDNSVAVYCILSTLVTSPCDNRKSDRNMMIINDMWQNTFCTCAFVGFVTLIQVIFIVIPSVSLKYVTKLRWRSQHENEKYIIKFRVTLFNKIARCCCTLRNPPLIMAIER
jgi:hypothetical protein